MPKLSLEWIHHTCLCMKSQRLEASNVRCKNYLHLREGTSHVGNYCWHVLHLSLGPRGRRLRSACVGPLLWINL